MVGATLRTPMGHRILSCCNHDVQHCQDPAMNLTDTVFEFLQQESEEHAAHSIDFIPDDDDSQDEETENASLNNEQTLKFWETQQQQLQATLRRTSSLETRIRNITKKALKELQTSMCSCQRPVAGGCRNCRMREICDRLQTEGFDSAICKCKWRSSPDSPPGEHTFVDMVDDSNPKKGNVRVIIELNFRSEFELARASEEYNQLVTILPEVYIGKVERLVSVIKILCSAAKRCMKEKKMHMGPWRKNGYMEAKWLNVSERFVSKKPLLTITSTRPFRPRSSMLTVDLSEYMINLHCAAVKVV